MAHSQGKSRELNSFSPVPTGLEGIVCRESCPVESHCLLVLHLRKVGDPRLALV